ncbi:MMPL family transporter [Arachnia propionica]|uniref:MMPL family transporter n=1 Tax=Arachnia propionica TaxID=1750 RepID=UPI003C6FA347
MLLFSDLGSSRSPGQVVAIGIAFAVLASLVFLPRLTHLPGRASYWPRVPRFDPDRTDEEQTRTGICCERRRGHVAGHSDRRG